MHTTRRVPARRLCVAVLSALLVAGNAAAFKPRKDFGHWGITTESARLTTFTTGTGEVLRFSEHAISELREANANTDEYRGGGEFWEPRAHCDDEYLALCTQRIIALKNQAISELLANPHNARAARSTIGRALHTVQDFYAHTNWTNTPGPGHRDFNPALGRSVVTSIALSQATCVNDEERNTLTGAGLTQITSGYFSLDPRWEPPTGKCVHGDLPWGGIGIAKDHPGRIGFGDARVAAAGATRDFLNQIIQAIKQDESAVRALMDIRPSIGFVIDDTGSMGRYINGVYSSVYTIGREAVADPYNTPDRMVLQTFNDPSIGSPQVYHDFASLLNGLGAIRPNGGGDCPELAMTGVLSGINAVTAGSSLFVYTDASSKDRYLSEPVGSLAASRKIVLNYVVSGSCSPIDPAYYDTASRTGGALFLAYNTELATPFIRALSNKNNRLVFSAFEELSNETRRYRVNVDSAATNLTISVGTDDIRDIKLTDPDGVDVTRDTSVANVLDFYSGAMATVAAPKPGEWTFEFTGTGKSFANAYVYSPISIIALDPVQMSGRLAHEDLFPIIGSPVLGDAGQIEATLEGAAADQLEVRRLNGELVDAHVFTADESEDVGASVHRYVTSVNFDATPVRFFLRGKDANGVTFMRAYPASYVAQPLRVSIEDAAFRLEPGHSRMVNFVIENKGPDADIDFTALASPAFIDPGFNPPAVHVASGTSAVVAVPVIVPADTEAESVRIVASASDAASPSRANSTIVELLVGTRDTDSDGVADDVDQCPASILDATVKIDACDSGTANHLFPEGCSISDEVAILRAAASNHGQFVSSTSHYAHDLVGLDVLNNQQASSIVNCAAKSRAP